MNPFDWHMRVGFADKISPRESLGAFLTTFNKLTTRRPAQLLVEPAKAATGRGHADVDQAAELLILNGLASLGYPTFYGPRRFETAGVDVVAFEVDGGIAYPISVTTGEDISACLGKLMVVRPEIEAGLGAGWTIKAVVITTLLRGSVVGAAIEQALAEGVLVLTGEDIACLLDESPDVRPFGEALRRVVIAPMHQSIRYGLA